MLSEASLILQGVANGQTESETVSKAGDMWSEQKTCMRTQAAFGQEIAVLTCIYMPPSRKFSAFIVYGG